jgi:hypothetical protein
MSVLRMYSDRIGQAMVLAWYARHQTQLVDPAHRGVALLFFFFAIVVTAHFESRLTLLSNANYRPLRIFLETLFMLVGVFLSWALVSIITEFYGEMLSPFLSFENSYRTLSFIILLSWVSSITTYMLEQTQLQRQ